MRRVGSPTFVHRPGLYHVFASPSHGGEPPTWTLRSPPVFRRIRMERRHREQSMVGTSTSIYCCKESLYIRGVPAEYGVRPTRARWRQNDRRSTLPAEYFLGKVRATFPGSHRAVRCRPTAFRSSYSRFALVSMS